jgi:hypothetical protein
MRFSEKFLISLVWFGLVSFDIVWSGLDVNWKCDRNALHCIFRTDSVDSTTGLDK